MDSDRQSQESLTDIDGQQPVVDAHAVSQKACVKLHSSCTLYAWMATVSTWFTNADGLYMCTAAGCVEPHDTQVLDPQQPAISGLTHVAAEPARQSTAAVHGANALHVHPLFELSHSMSLTNVKKFSLRAMQNFTVHLSTIC